MQALPFLVLGSGCVVAGGFVAAVTALAPSEHGAWAAAYLVLVCGVAQVALGGGQSLLSSKPFSRGATVAELLAWNVGNAAVLAGTLLALLPVADLGGALLVVALALAVWQVRGVGGGAVWVRHGFRLLLAIVLVSIPVGLVLAQLRSAY